MATKIGTGVVLAAGALAAVLFAPWWLLAFLLGGIVLAALAEFLMLPDRRDHGDVAVGTVLGAVVLAAVVVGDDAGIWVRLAGASAFVAVAALLSVLFRPVPIEKAGHRAGHLLAGLSYVAVLGALAMVLVRDERGEHGRYVFLIVAAVTWLNDTMAYFGGKLMGRHKMAPRVSPNKTWEGAAWGMVGSVAGALLVRAIAVQVGAWPDAPLWPVVGFALLGGALGQAGDLVESLFKRTFAVKDSGGLLPGHGGFLDRIDAFLFTAPLGYFWFFQWFS